MHRKICVQNIQDTMNYIYGSWLPNSGRVQADGPEYALYSKNVDPLSPNAEVRIYIPLTQ
ncbi:MAG: GyrI-like domain-containing protein [Kordiimonadaceae bacterium]|nr:GyrI-like domain-containing protein [Kordiimonadaceae bacterium]